MTDDPAVRRRILLAGAVLAGIGVAFGAFGAHALRAALDERHLGWWRTGVEYQMWHAVALVALAAAPVRAGAPAALLAAGTVIFSGSLYLMALTDARWLGAITPLGGLLMLAGWSLLAWRTMSGGFGDGSPTAADQGLRIVEGDRPGR